MKRPANIRESILERSHICLLLLALGCPALTSQAAGVFDVRKAGAKGDGKTIDTGAIQTALDECGKAGGGTVRFPAGTYLSKPIVMRDRTIIELEAGATLQATDEPADFKRGSNSNYIHFLTGRNLTDIAIIGPGVIDGAGAKWWVPAEEARRKVSGYTLPRPNLIVLTGCKNVRLVNLTLQNSPKFHFVPTDCDGVLVSNVTVLAPPRSPNTDAIDPSISRNVVITKCRIDVGDDNIAIKSGKKVEGREFACENITVTDCAFLHGHGMSIGSETVGGVRNVTVRNCTFEGTENGIRIKSQRGKGGLIENISYSDITMKNVDPAITLTCYYATNSAQDAVQHALPADEAREKTASTPIYRNIRISNLTATSQRSAGLIVGLPESPVSNVILDNVRISAAGSGLLVRTAKGVEFKHVQIIPKSGPPVIVVNAEVKGVEDGGREQTK
jgi:polygalacturonase